MATEDARGFQFMLGVINDLRNRFKICAKKRRLGSAMVWAFWGRESLKVNRSAPEGMGLGPSPRKPQPAGEDAEQSEGESGDDESEFDEEKFMNDGDGRDTCAPELAQIADVTKENQTLIASMTFLCDCLSRLVLDLLILLTSFSFFLYNLVSVPVYVRELSILLRIF
jgi:hypothetical protein